MTTVSPLALKQYVGVYFRPTDEQLLQYLYSKVHGISYFEGAVFDCDLYGGNEPWEIWEYFKGVDDGEDLYFFTTLKRSTTKNSGRLSAHINRKIGLSNGTWSGENSASPIFANETDQTIIGYRKRFRYENVQLAEHHGEWIMHEYSLREDLMRQDVDPIYVLCRMRKNERPKRKAEKGSELQQPRKKRIVAPNISCNKIPMKRCLTELQPAKQVEMTPERCLTKSQPANQIEGAPEMISNMPDMTLDLDTVMNLLETEPTLCTSMDTVRDPSINLDNMPRVHTTIDQSTNDGPYMLEITTDLGTSEVHVPQMNTNEGMSVTIDEETTLEEYWRNISDLIDL